MEVNKNQLFPSALHPDNNKDSSFLSRLPDSSEKCSASSSGSAEGSPEGSHLSPLQFFKETKVRE